MPFFKKIFNRSINSFLDIFNTIFPLDIGHSAISVLSEEVSKGILRADFIVKTDKQYILIFEFKDEIGIDAYSAINAYVATHAHTTKVYNSVLSQQKSKIPYIPIIIGFSLQKQYRSHLITQKIIRNASTNGAYVIAASPYYEIYLFIINEMNLSETIINLARHHPKLKRHFDAIQHFNTADFWSRAIINPHYRTAGIVLLQYFGELMLLAKYDPDYFKSVYDFANVCVPDHAKDILDLMVIIFLRRKVDGIMSLSEVLTLEEKKRVIEAFGVDVAIETFGIENVIEAIGIERVIDAAGIDRVIDAIGIDRVIAAADPKRVINALKKLVDEGKLDKKYLKKLLG